ncbi:uncharacterized protein EI90DRAFT_2189690 [Cantharellus anzutake]|uniref:uncharacterized protein n=1 Tax=Cantharellus anzutake TaxID=1750568 RepID=UPI0019053049|nr:uncharacterized protein EI90DRAFT_2189690 [Cantharellus anzutake]KAF8325289.1 hypothetical protein EI90DRAFT_2189690 [Cantharellus anzutake]
MARSLRPYNLSLSVIQSSGMGKSRMVAEASLSVFTIPINIREELGHGLENTEFRRYFQGHHAKSDLRLQAEYAITLSVLFTKAAALLEKPRFKYKTGAELAYEWAEYLDEGRTDTEVGMNRKVFLDSVVDGARKLKLMELRPDERENWWCSTPECRSRVTRLLRPWLVMMGEQKSNASFTLMKLTSLPNSSHGKRTWPGVARPIIILAHCCLS